MGSLGQRSLLPFDGQQPLAQHAIVVAALGDTAAELQPTRSQQDCPVLVKDVEVGLGRCGVGSSHPHIAIAGVAGRTVGA